MKVAVQIIDIVLNPGINKPPYCIGRDRGGRNYSPIWFTYTGIPAQWAIHWIEEHGRRWLLGPPLIGQPSLDGLGVGDTKISAENLFLIGNDTLSLSAGNEIDLNETKITNAPTPTDDSDLATKEYVDLVAPVAAPHATTHQTGGVDEVYFSQLERSSIDSTLHDAYTTTPHVSATEKSNWGDAYNHSQDGTIHLSSGEKTDLTDGGTTTLHSHSHTHLGIEEVTDASKSMAVNYRYIANRGTLITFTMPASASLGDTIYLRGKGAGGWKIAQNAGQVIHFLGVDTTTGAGGYLASTLRYDCIELMCITANTEWIVASLMGNITVF